MKLSKNDQLVFDFLSKELDTKDFKLLSNQSIIDGTGIKHASQLRRTVDRLIEKELIIKKKGQNFNTYKLTKMGKQLVAIESKPILEVPVIDEDETFYNHQILLVYNYLQDLTKGIRVSKLELIPPTLRKLIKEALKENDRDTILNILDLKYKEWKDKPSYRKNLTAKTLFKPDLFQKYKQQLENKKKYEDYPTKRYLPKPVLELRKEIVSKQQRLMGSDDSQVYPLCEKLYNLGYRRWQFFKGNIFTKEWGDKFFSKYYPNGLPEREEHLFLTKRNYR